MQRLFVFIASLIFLTILIPFAVGQDLQPSPDVSPLDPGSQLISWTEMQEPHPVPQPEPRPGPLPDPQPEQSRDQQKPDRPDQQPDASASNKSETRAGTDVFTGTIVKAAESYVLKAQGDTTYALDDQERARRFEGKRVKVTGKLDAGSKTIQIGNIEPLS